MTPQIEGPSYRTQMHLESIYEETAPEHCLWQCVQATVGCVCKGVQLLSIFHDCFNKY